MPNAAHSATLSASQESKLLRNVWSGNPALGIPSGITYVNYTSLYQTGDTLPQTMNRLNANATLSVVMFPDGFDGVIPDFGQGLWTSGSDAVGGYGIYNQYLQGLGGSGPKQVRISQGANTLSSAALTYLTNQNTSSNPNTTQWTSMRVGGNYVTNYVFGMTLQGNDQGTITDYKETGPARYQGFGAYQPGENSIYQNLRIVGLGHSDGASPPAETFAWGESHSTNLLFRNNEIDGRLVNGINRSGMLGVNSATNITLANCYLHDSYTSGLTFSTAGTLGVNPTTTITTTDLKIANNATGGRFTGINHENVAGNVNHIRPDISVPNMTQWDMSHMTLNQYNQNATMTVTEPTWHESPSYNNGCFVIYTDLTYGGATTSPQTTAPVVIKNGVSLTPYIKTTYNTVDSSITSSTHYIWIRPT